MRAARPARAKFVGIVEANVDDNHIEFKTVRIEPDGDVRYPGGGVDIAGAPSL